MVARYRANSGLSVGWWATSLETQNQVEGGIALTRIFGHPDQVSTALDTKRATGATVTVTNVRNLLDGRVVVDAEIIESTTTTAPVYANSRTSTRVRKHGLARLWACVAPEPLEDILHPGETCRVWKHRHWFLQARSVLMGLAGLPLAIALSYVFKVVAEHIWWLHAILWLVPVFNVIQIGYKVLEWMSDRIIVTDRRLILASGVLGRRIQSIPLSRIRGIDVVRTPVGRVFGYGSFKIGYPDCDLEDGARGLPGGRVEFVPNPKQVYHATGVPKLT